LTSYTNLHRFIIFTTLCTLLLLVAGGLVTSTQSGLSVPDWPTTYGHFMFAYPLDQMVGGIFYEHSHRMIASVVGFLTAIVAVWLWKREERPWVKYLGLAAIGAVILQGVLGGLTVLFLLPTVISASHATLAQTFFSIMVILTAVTSSWWRTDLPMQKDTGRVSLSRLTAWTAIAIYIQLIFGAVMRHMDAGLAVPTFPLSYGQIFPSLSADALARYNQQLIDANLRLAADDPVSAGQIIIHLLHRYWAFLVALSVITTAIAAFKQRHGFRRGAYIGIAMMALLLIQGTLGALTVLSAKAVDITTAHVATGAALLGTAILLHMHARKTFGRRSSPLPLQAQPVITGATI
jgi:cytochrome c oxidase assembly protein subunit 15